MDSKEETVCEEGFEFCVFSVKKKKKKKKLGKTDMYPGPPPFLKERVKFSVLFQAVSVDCRGAIILIRDETEGGNESSLNLFTYVETMAVRLELMKD